MDAQTQPLDESTQFVLTTLDTEIDKVLQTRNAEGVCEQHADLVDMAAAGLVADKMLVVSVAKMQTQVGEVHTSVEGLRTGLQEFNDTRASEQMAAREARSRKAKRNLRILTALLGGGGIIGVMAATVQIIIAIKGG